MWMLDFLRKKTTENEKAPVKKEASNTVIAVWSPYGADTANFSNNLAQEISKYSYTALIEPPCLGIPRLAVACDIKDRDNHAEAVISEYEKTGRINFELFTKKNSTLAILPAGYYAVPDYPIAARVELETLIEFPTQVINAARNNGYPQVIFECQGQLTHPMTFFAIKNADYVLVPINDPTELAFALINFKRLLHVYKYSADKFKIVTSLEPDYLAEVLYIKDDEGHSLGKPDVWSYDLKELLARLGYEGLEIIRSDDKKNILTKLSKIPFKGKEKGSEPKVTQKSEELPEEPIQTTIRL